MWTQFALTVLATSALSLTVTNARIFREARTWVTERSAWWGDLVTCPYCFSHWVAAVLVVSNPTLRRGWFVVTMAVVALASIVTGLIVRSLSALGQEED